MKQANPDSSASDEQKLAAEIERMTGGTRRTDEHDLPGTYWSNMLVKTNSRIDDVSSVRALSIGWALRVAIPGVVAIISFLIGLHYYSPEEPKKETTVASMIRSMPQAEKDTLLLTPGPYEEGLRGEDLEGVVFDIPRDAISDYFAANGRASEIVDVMDEGEVKQVVTALDGAQY